MLRTLLAVLIISSAVFAADKPDDIVGKVTSVIDGDTLKISETVIRLEGIDAPERKQPFGGEARRWLDRSVCLKTVRVVVTGKDRYGRTLGIVHVGDRNMNEELVQMGFAWHYKKHSKDKRLAELEVEARNAKSGLWSDEKQIPPWEWRKRKAVK